MAAVLAAFEVPAGMQFADRPLTEISGNDPGEPAAAFLPIDCQHRFGDVAIIQKVGCESPEGFCQIGAGDISCLKQRLDEWARLFELSDRHGFVIASDECYSEIRFGDEPPLGGLEAAAKLGRSDFRRLVALTSLSKRSNVPGLRSGFVAGDAAILKQFLLYRTYHGGAMSPSVQRASASAWADEAHVEANRALYREKFARVTPILAEALDVALPDAGFYLWAAVPERFAPQAAASGLSLDEWFTRELLAQYNVAVLPGSYLAREAQGVNPGSGRVRMALVAGVDECVEAARRIRAFIQAAA